MNRDELAGIYDEWKQSRNGPTVDFDAWFITRRSQNGASGSTGPPPPAPLSNATLLSMDRTKRPARARKFTHMAFEQGYTFRSKLIEESRILQTFNRGIMVRFNFAAGSKVMYGELKGIYDFEFMGTRYTLCDADWYQDVRAFKSLGVMCVKTHGRGGTVVGGFAKTETFVDAWCICGQFFYGEMSLKQSHGPPHGPGHYRMILENRQGGRPPPDNDLQQDRSQPPSEDGSD